MKNLYHRLLLLIAGATQKELASQIRYLKIENEILRSKLPKRVPVTEKERNKLVKFGSKLGKAQAQAFLNHVEEAGLDVGTVMHDRDTKFTASFDEILAEADVKVKQAAHRSPNTNAFVERFIQTLQQECLDYFIVFGEQHMDHLVSEMVSYYHAERPHQSKGNEPLVQSVAADEPKKRKRKTTNELPPLEVVPISQIACHERLGGLLKHYYRKAA